MLTIKFEMESREKDFKEVKFVQGSKKPKVGEDIIVRPPQGMKIPVAFVGESASGVGTHEFHGFETWEGQIISKTVTDTLEGDREIVYSCDPRYYC